MDADRWARLQDLFHRAAELPDADRHGFLDAECADDPSLMRDALAMLAADASNAPVIDAGIAPVAQQLLGPTSTLSLADFGAYRVREVVGEGGMGVVYRAERTDLGSIAAVKVLRDAWLSPARRERFAAEQRMLAQLNHPGVARLYDAGSFGDGTPWIVMEFVDGEPITAFCRRHRTPLAERLRLFRAVCAAVQHAHEHAVIHRDIKPSNILVTAAGEVKLLDFGIAKQLAEQDESVDQTRTGLRLLTPAYAAPEQVRGDPVGLHTDVYSLGVVLYELLTGRLPFDLARHTPEEVVSIVATHEPERPSLAARRTPAADAPPEAGRTAWSDLDVLCLTAMQKDPQRRYRTVEAFIRDVDHYLAGEPLEARPDSRRYRAGKFVRRHWREVSASSLAAAVVIALVVFYTLRLASARDVAVAEAARTQRIQAFTLNLFRGGDELVGPADSLRVVTLLQRGEQEARLLDREPEIQAELYATLGGIYQQLGRLEHADSLLRSALVRRQRLGGAYTASVADNLVALGLLHLERAHLPEGERLIREGLTLARRELPAGHPAIARATAALGQALEEKGEYGKAVPILEEAVRLHWLADSTSPDVTAALRQLGSTHFYAGNYDLADSVNRQVLAMTQRQLGERHPLVADDLVNLGATRFERGDYAGAENYYREALAITKPFFGEAHHRTAGNLVMLGRAILYQRRFDEAAPLLREALSTRERVYGPVHPSVASVLNELGNLSMSRQQLDDAEGYFRRMGAIYRAIHGDRHYLLAVAVSNEAGVRVARRDFAGAEGLYRDAVARFAATQGPTSLNVGIARIKLGRAILRQSRFEEAERETLAGYEIVSREAAPTVSFLTAAREDLAAAYDALGRPDRAAHFRAEQAAVDSAASSK
jgi:serine/threonine-protein kinase